MIAVSIGALCLASQIIGGKSTSLLLGPAFLFVTGISAYTQSEWSTIGFVLMVGALLLYEFMAPNKKANEVQEENKS